MADPSAPSPLSSSLPSSSSPSAVERVAPASAAPIIRFDGVGKSFPGVRALAGITFDVETGSCHALCGENGAGKSTLAKVLAGIHAPDAGTIVVAGQAARFAGPRAALAAGIALVHQELAACENLTVGENLCLGALPARGPFVSWRQVERRAVRDAGRDRRRDRRAATPWARCPWASSRWCRSRRRWAAARA